MSLHVVVKTWCLFPSFHWKRLYLPKRLKKHPTRRGVSRSLYWGVWLLWMSTTTMQSFQVWHQNDQRWSPADLDCSGIARAPMPNPVWRRLCKCARGHCDWQTLTLLNTLGYFWSLEPMFDSFVMWWVETLQDCILQQFFFPASLGFAGRKWVWACVHWVHCNSPGPFGGCSFQRGWSLGREKAGFTQLLWKNSNVSFGSLSIWLCWQFFCEKYDKNIKQRVFFLGFPMNFQTNPYPTLTSSCASLRHSFSAQACGSWRWNLCGGEGMLELANHQLYYPLVI